MLRTSVHRVDLEHRDGVWRGGGGGHDLGGGTFRGEAYQREIREHLKWIEEKVDTGKGELREKFNGETTKENGIIHSREENSDRGFWRTQ
jgi:hypothetical protein